MCTAPELRFLSVLRAALYSRCFILPPYRDGVLVFFKSMRSWSCRLGDKGRRFASVMTEALIRVGAPLFEKRTGAI